MNKAAEQFVDGGSERDNKNLALLPRRLNLCGTPESLRYLWVEKTEKSLLLPILQNGSGVPA